MCCLLLCKSRALNKDEFEEAWSRNKDGFGYAYRKDKKVVFKKGMMDKNIAFEEYNKINNIFPHVAHFRLGNPVCEELTHPFLCTEDSELILEGETDEPVLFHNGVVASWEKYLLTIFLKLGHIPEGDWSDTRVVAIICKILGTDALKYIDGKFISFSPTKTIISGKFEDEKNGIVASNTSYVKSTWVYGGNNKQTDRSSIDEFLL